MNAYAYLSGLKGKRVAVCGIGRNNLPVIRQLLGYGAVVTACDRRTREELGEVAEELTAAGVTLQLGEDYLARLDAELVLRTPGMKPYLPEFEAARQRGVTVTSEMELFFDLCPAPIYAVTGSDGKTTTTTVIAGLLAKAGKKVFLGGNIGRPLLPLVEEITADDVAVVELSSFQLTLMHKKPAVAVVTNIAPNHLDWHTDMAEYVEAKHNLIASQTPAERTVLNADNAYTAAFAADAPGTVWQFSRQGEPDRGAYLRDGVLCVVDGRTVTPILPAADIRIPGVHNVENYLAAFAAVWGTVSPEVMAAYAREFGGVPHRCELVRTVDGARYYNDSIGSSPSRTIAGLKAFDRKVILIAGGYDKHIPYAPLGEVMPQTVKCAILLGATADKIEAAVKAVDPAFPVIRVADLPAAVAAAKAEAKEGDIVFFSPASASFDMYKNFEERGEHFKAIVMGL